MPSIVGKRQLVVGSARHADGAFDVGCFNRRAFLKALIEVIERAAGLVGRHHLAGNGHRIAARLRVDLQALFNEFQMLVKLAEKFAGQPVVLECKHEVIGVVHGFGAGTRAVGISSCVFKRAGSFTLGPIPVDPSPNRLLGPVTGDSHR